MTSARLSFTAAARNIADNYDLILDKLDIVPATDLRVNFVLVGNVLSINYPDLLFGAPRQVKLDLVDYICNRALNRTDADAPANLYEWVRKYPKIISVPYCKNHGIHVIPGLGRYADSKVPLDDDMTRIYEAILDYLYPDSGESEAIPEPLDVDEEDEEIPSDVEDPGLPTGTDLLNDFDENDLIVEESAPIRDEPDPLEKYIICVGKNVYSPLLKLISFAPDEPVESIHRTLDTILS